MNLSSVKGNEMRALAKPNWQVQREKSKRNKLLGVLFVILVLVIGFSVFAWKKFNLSEAALFSETFSEVPLEVSGKTILVKKGGNFQEALNKAVSGDTILLEAGVSFKGNFKLPNKNGTEFITIRTSATDAQLPPPNVRLDPKKYGAVLPKIVPVTKGEPAITTVNGSHHWRFIGIEFQNTVDGLYNIIQIGSTEEKTLTELPHHFEFDRVYLHGSPTVGQRRGIAANGKNIIIKNSYFAEFKRQGEESQAIAIWAGDGPCEITNNYLEAASESIMIGGAGSNLGLTPGDCLVKNNWMNKKLEWKGGGWVVKNFFEIKNGRRIKVENNLMTNNWLDAQEGMSVLFTTREGDSGKKATIEDIEFTNNIVRGSGSAVNVYGPEGLGGRRLIIRNNIFEDIGKNWDGTGVFLKVSAWDGLTVENNTVIHSGNITLAWGKPTKNFIFRNNIVFQNEYGFFGDGAGVGKPAIMKYFPNPVLTNNIIIGGTSADYGTNNFFPTSVNQIGFANAGKNDYRLSAGNSYLTKGFGGKQIGASLDPSTVGGTKF